MAAWNSGPKRNQAQIHIPVSPEEYLEDTCWVADCWGTGEQYCFDLEVEGELQMEMKMELEPRGRGDLFYSLTNP